jgi:hypothetical protein
MQELQDIIDTLFIDTSSSYNQARISWQRLAKDPLFIVRVMASGTTWQLPTWRGVIDTTIPVQAIHSYHVIAVDGSQIYPDRHQGSSCFLINIGSIVLHYGTAHAQVQFNSVPRVFTEHGDAYEGLSSVDDINGIRQDLELKAGYDVSCVVRGQIKDQAPLLLLFDGSLIFWHLHTKEEKIRSFFLQKYMVSLQQLYEQQILTASYISSPKSKELVNLVRFSMGDDADNQSGDDDMDCIVDVAIAGFFLLPHTRSTVFQNNASISDYYPPALRPHFFYLHVGIEIGRVEIPAWIASDELLVDLIAQIIVDQCRKGSGYPVALAEAHEQAVVKGPDREFFYHLLQKISMSHNQQLRISPKSLKKRGIGI